MAVHLAHVRGGLAAEHAGGGPVVLGELGPPARPGLVPGPSPVAVPGPGPWRRGFGPHGFGPRGVGEELVLRLEQYASPHDAATTHSGAADDPDVPQHPLPEEPTQPELRHPQVLAGIAPRGEKVLAGMPPALFQHEHRSALLGQAQCGHGAPETTAHDDHVGRGHHASWTVVHLMDPRRSPALAGLIRRRQQSAPPVARHPPAVARHLVRKCGRESHQMSGSRASMSCNREGTAAREPPRRLP